MLAAAWGGEDDALDAEVGCVRELLLQRDRGVVAHPVVRSVELQPLGCDDDDSLCFVQTCHRHLVQLESWLRSPILSALLVR